MRCSYNKILKWIILVIIATTLFNLLRGHVKDDKSSVYSNNTSPLKQDANQRSPEMQADDVFLSIKTSSKYHGDRLGIVLATWWNYAPNSVNHLACLVCSENLFFIQQFVGSKC